MPFRASLVMIGFTVSHDFSAQPRSAAAPSSLAECHVMLPFSFKRCFRCYLKLNSICVHLTGTLESLVNWLLMKFCNKTVLKESVLLEYD